MKKKDPITEAAKFVLSAESGHKTFVDDDAYIAAVMQRYNDVRAEQDPEFSKLEEKRVILVGAEAIAKNFRTSVRHKSTKTLVNALVDGVEIDASEVPEMWIGTAPYMVRLDYATKAVFEAHLDNCRKNKGIQDVALTRTEKAYEKLDAQMQEGDTIPDALRALGLLREED